MDFVRAIKFPFEDREWPVKLVIGSLLSWVPFVSTGYQISVARNVMQQKENPLPGTEDLGKVITDGVMGTIAWIIYLIPLWPFIFVSMCISGADNDGGFATCVSCCVTILAFAYAIPASMLYVMGLYRYINTGNFSSFIQIGSLWRDVTANMNALVTLVVYLVAVSILAAVAGTALVITCVGPLVVAFLAQVAIGHLIGQAASSIKQAA